MPYYIRFLKAPRHDSHRVWAVVKICNDLGEVAAEAFSFTAMLFDGSTDKPDDGVIYIAKDYTWNPGMHELKIEFDAAWNIDKNKGELDTYMILHTKECSYVRHQCGWNDEEVEDGEDTKIEESVVQDSKTADDEGEWEDDSEDDDEPNIEELEHAHTSFLPSLEHSVCQKPIHKLVGAMASINQMNSAYFFRNFLLCNFRTVEVAEAIGESISGHIWDGGLALTCAANHFTSLARMGGAAYKTEASKEILNILELGSGTGIVGAAIGTLVKRCNLTLTDLPSSMDALNETINITGIEAFDSDESDSEDEESNNSEDAEYKEVSTKELEWQEDTSQLPDWINNPYHVVIIADCTYNPDNYSKLISTLKAITNKSPKALILYASKRRHEDESKFEKMLEESSFFVKQAWQDTHLDSEQIIDIKTVIRKSPNGENWASEPPSWIPYHPLEGFWWSPKEISSDASKRGFLRTMFERRLPQGEESWTEIFSMGRNLIKP